MRRALLLTLAALLAAPAAAYADEAIAELPRAVPAAGYAGWEAWSQYSERARRYALVLRDPQGAIREAPVPAQSQPWDVSLGPDAHGDVVAIYQRCTLAGCDVRRLYVEDGREQSLHSVSAPQYREATPAIWRSTVVFTRRIGGCDVPYVKDLSSSASSRRLLHDKCVQTRPGQASVRGTRIVISSQAGTRSGRKVSELRRYSAREGGSKVILSQGFGEESNLFGQVAQDERFAYTVRYGVHPRNGFVRVSWSTGRVEEVRAFRDLSGGFAKPTPNRSVYVEAQSGEGPDCGVFTTIPCRLVQSPSIPFAGVVRVLTPELTIAYQGTPRRGQPLTFTGTLTRRAVSGDEVVRTDPVPGVDVALQHRIAGSPEPLEPTGLTGVTGPDGTWRIVLPAVGDDPWYTALAATTPVPTWAGRGTVGSVVP